MRDPQPGRAPPLRRELLDDRRDGVPLSGDHDRAGSVDRSQARTDREQRTYLLLTGLQGGHGPALWQRLHEPPPRRDQPRGVGQRQHPCRVCGRQLANRVPGEQIRPYAPRLGQPEQRHLDGEESGLGELRPVHRLGVLAPQDVA